MRNEKIINSWDKIKPDNATHERILDNILDRVHSGETQKGKVKNMATKQYWKILAPVAACLIIAIAVIVPTFFKNGVNDPILNPPNNGDNSSMQAGERGIYIPAIELPGKTDGSVMSMIGLFVYQGHIYTQASRYYNEAAEYIKENLVGEKIGFSIGNIDEWSTQDEYAFEFAGTVYGDVYSVKGYDESFRLCMMESYTDDNGNDVQWVNFYERLNGIGLGHGHNLFEDRLKLSDNWNHVQYQPHDDWDYDRNNFCNLTGITDDDITGFVNALYDGWVENVFETTGNNNFYANNNQSHLYFYMNDTTVIELRLFEGGYVGYQHLGWYFVKMPGEAFQKIFNACK